MFCYDTTHTEFHHHNHHDVPVMELGHLWTRSGLFQKSLQWYSLVPSAFWRVAFLLSWVICYKAFCLHVILNLFCSPVFCPRLGLHLIHLKSLHLYYNLTNCILLLFSYYFILASVTLLAYLALMVQLSQPYGKDGRACVLNNFTIVCFKVFCGLNALFIMPVIFKQLHNMLSMSTSFS